MDTLQKFEQFGTIISAEVSSLSHRFLVSADSILPYIPEYLKSSPLSSAAATAFLGYVTYFVAIKYYKLNLPREWHNIPLISSWQFTKEFLSFKLSLDQRYYKYTKQIYEKHDILRTRVLGSETVIVGSPEYAKEVLTNTEVFPKLEIGNSNTLGSRFIGVSVFFSNGDTWLRHRKIVSPAFHRGWDPVVFGNCAINMFKQIVKRGDNGRKSIEITTLSQSLTLDALGKAAFDFDFDSLSNPENGHVNAYNEAFKGTSNPIFFLFPFLDRPIGPRAKAYKAVDELNAFFYDMIDKRRAKLKAEGVPDKNKADLLTLMIQATYSDDDNSNRFTEKELRDNIMTFFLAGHDTTAVALSCAIYYLAKNPEKQEKARKEVLSVLGDQPVDYIPTMEEIQNLPYISMIIKETLRLSPSSPFVGRVPTTKDTAVGPYIIPAGSRVHVDIFALHHNPKYWGPDAEEFKPERWEDETLEKRNAYIYLPFSSGSRACMGMNFSLIEQRVVLTMLLCKFIWSLPADSPHKDRLQCRPGILLQLKGLEINFKSRY